MKSQQQFNMTESEFDALDRTFRKIAEVKQNIKRRLELRALPASVEPLPPLQGLDRQI